MGRTGRSTAVVALARALWGTLRSGEAGLGTRLRALPRLTAATMRGRYRGTTRTRLGLIALALVYTVSPLDLVPEALFGLFGLVDDALVLSWAVGRILVETDAFLSWERGGTRPSDVVPGQIVSG